ncbi:tryptophan synthase beta subunit-like PLP-dependent enzyme [Aspergillus heteromorphus CBS 117.55]|uniref:Tryptophan synthase beta subunit-like PLP-dependent enzyme n=1 Tax=Aspergillus heteromorphus CBS 117.55 TaxID=1448321 RepID=A0A317W206_9EURO|nr:tryptophan synthase beta subunit-like PLP-dependent enzyme [Aspergillus heteromorphus CBS 117.55]PWY79631.1 tryptophan synthase beta subunit-like PLP-dependent enzyme [Aspergillus heteromorphus CBS 117.55]
MGEYEVYTYISSLPARNPSPTTTTPHQLYNLLATLNLQTHHHDHPPHPPLPNPAPPTPLRAPFPHPPPPSPNRPPQPPLPFPRTPHITLHLKREDHSSPLTNSGNKYRKLEYLIPDILSAHPQHGGLAPGPAHGTASPPTSTSQPPQRTTTLVTEGAIQSNHTIQVAAVANHLGLETVVVLHKGAGGGLSASTDKEAFLRTGNVQIAGLLGAEVRVVDSSTIAIAIASGKGEGEKESVVSRVLEELRAKGKNPYWIPSGASLHPLGGLGYARCAVEIAAQERGRDIEGGRRVDYVFVACGSGSTVGGLIAGFKLLEKMEREEEKVTQRPPRKVIGIIISPTQSLACHQERVLGFARQAAGLIGLDPQREVSMDDVILDDRFAGTRYGVLDAETKEALTLMARKEAVMLDPVYTAKVFRGMKHWVQEGELARDWTARVGASSGYGHDQERVNALLMHTGGQSALSAYADVE